MPTYDNLGYAPGGAIARGDTRTVFGQVMGLVALTVGCAALGAYVGAISAAVPGCCSSSARSPASSV